MLVALGASLAAAFLLLAAVHVHGLLAWVVCTPLVAAAARTCSWRRAAAMGGLFGITVALCGDAPWVAAAGRLYFNWPPWQAVLAASALGVLCGGSFGVLLGMTTACTLRLPRAWPILAFPAAWVTWEILIVRVLPYYPWVSLAATQTQSPALLQIASLAGQAGLSYAVAAVGAACGLAWARRRVRHVLTGFTIIACSAVFGQARLSTVPEPAEMCTVWAVDARIASSEEGRDEIMQRYATLTRRALEQKANVIVWPESALPGYLETDIDLQRRIRDLLRDSHAMIIAGGPRTDWLGGWKRRLFNSAYGIDAARPLQSYDKRRLVPFVEYWPQIGMRRPSWLSTEEVTPGSQPILFTAAGCRFGVLICFEAEQPELAADALRAGADALLVLSNDAQLPEEAARKELRQAQLRAVETGVPVLRAANHGTTVSIDRYGIVRHTQTGGAFRAELARGHEALAVSLAPFFRIACIIATVLAVGFGVRRQ